MTEFTDVHMQKLYVQLGRSIWEYKSRKTRQRKNLVADSINFYREQSWYECMVSNDLSLEEQSMAYTDRQVVLTTNLH